jgi:hypothetical protein
MVLQIGHFRLLFQKGNCKDVGQRLLLMKMAFGALLALHVLFCFVLFGRNVMYQISLNFTESWAGAGFRCERTSDLYLLYTWNSSLILF